MAPRTTPDAPAPAPTPAVSAIQPHLVRLSGSGADLDEGVVERGLERAGGIGEAADGPSRHVVVVHTGRSADLRWSLDGHPRRERFHRGQALVNPAGWASRPRWEQDAELLLVALEPTWLEKLATESDLPGPLELAPRFHLTDPFLGMLVERLVAEYERSQPADPLYAQSMLQALAAHLIRIAATRRPAGPAGGRGSGLAPKRLDQVIDHMNGALDGRLPLAELAAVAGVSPSHFTRAFRASTGQSPHQYLVRLRLERARRALLTTDTPIAVVAQLSGFADQSHLTRTMRLHTGLTPAALRAGRDR
ncbi:helix-turn-helix domain-containing protein [Streptomyces rubellomurinus]|uniref:helix-turn-helix domain-containing protein n=1 Tax=Streptomyces rubellomurinus (strain ATCC 31215) TaxID=359131 RepID=UPI0005F0FD0A|nr:AraC family transcriptional regulator [Streptomyces rubellomurinus]